MTVQDQSAIVVNGKRRPYSDASLAELLSDLGIDPARRGLAVARNGGVVPRANWAEIRIAPGDRIEIVQPLAGG